MAEFSASDSQSSFFLVCALDGIVKVLVGIGLANTPLELVSVDVVLIEQSLDRDAELS